MREQVNINSNLLLLIITLTLSSLDFTRLAMYIYV